MANQTLPSPSPRFTWAKLNADTLFLGLLAAGSGFFAFLDPSKDAVVQHVGGDPKILFYLRAGAYLLSGLLLILALGTQSVRVETIARAALVGGVALNVYRHATWLGWSDTDTKAAVVLLVFIALTSCLRLSVLLSRDGLVVTQEGSDDVEAHQ